MIYVEDLEIWTGMMSSDVGDVIIRLGSKWRTLGEVRSELCIWGLLALLINSCQVEGERVIGNYCLISSELSSHLLRGQRRCPGSEG